MDINTQLDRLAPRPESPQEVIERYQELYPGTVKAKNGKAVEEWKVRLAEAIQPHTRGKNGEPLSMKAIMRRFQGGRGPAAGKKISPQQQKEYKAVADQLPRKLPAGKKIRATGYVWIKYSKGFFKKKIRQNGVDGILLEGEAAQAFLETGDPQIISNLYNGLSWDDSEGYGTGETDLSFSLE